jgi:predicted phosphoribosyltransferase
MFFADRADAGRRLAARLEHLRGERVGSITDDQRRIARNASSVSAMTERSYELAAPDLLV